jgi:putative transposase
MAPKRIITDKLGSYGAAKKQVMPMVEHRSHKGLNKRAENSHVPFRKRERVLQYFRLARAVQRFVSIFSDFRNFFVPPRYKRFRFGINPHRLNAFVQWKILTSAG